MKEMTMTKDSSKCRARISGRRTARTSGSSQTHNGSSIRVRACDFGERVELRGVMWMPRKETLVESALSAKYFNSLDDMRIFLSVMFGIGGDFFLFGDYVQNEIGVSNLTRLAAFETETDTKHDVGYFFTAYYPSVFERAKLEA